jgi:hypothetical protein
LASDDAINPAAQQISAVTPRFSRELTGKAVGLRLRGYPYLGNREAHEPE